MKRTARNEIFGLFFVLTYLESTFCQNYHDFEEICPPQARITKLTRSPKFSPKNGNLTIFCENFLQPLTPKPECSWEPILDCDGQKLEPCFDTSYLAGLRGFELDTRTGAILLQPYCCLSKLIHVKKESCINKQLNNGIQSSFNTEISVKSIIRNIGCSPLFNSDKKISDFSWIINDCLYDYGTFPAFLGNGSQFKQFEEPPPPPAEISSVFTSTFATKTAAWVETAELCDQACRLLNFIAVASGSFIGNGNPLFHVCSVEADGQRPGFQLPGFDNGQCNYGKRRALKSAKKLCLCVKDWMIDGGAEESNHTRHLSWLSSQASESCQSTCEAGGFVHAVSTPKPNPNNNPYYICAANHAKHGYRGGFQLDGYHRNACNVAFGRRERGSAEKICLCTYDEVDPYEILLAPDTDSVTM